MLLFVACAVAASVVARSAQAFTDYTSFSQYVFYVPTAAGGQHLTPGWNYRTENDACRSDNTGYEEATYINTNHVYVSATGPISTNCNLGAYAILLNNGYYQSGCDNQGTVTHTMYCITYMYSP